MAITAQPSPLYITLILLLSAAFFTLIALACWGIEALWNKVFFPRADRRPFPPHGAMPAARALKFTAVHMVWIILATLAGNTALMALLDYLDVKLPVQEIVEWFANPNSPWTVKLAIALFAIVEAPIVEELIFRRFVFRALLRGMPRLPFLAYLVSGALFAVTHANLAVCLPILFLGSAFAWVYWRTGRIWTTMLMHSVFNATNLLLLLTFPETANL